MSKKVFLVHRWEGGPEKDWIPWVKRELGKYGFQVYAPAMPDTERPKMDAWVSHLAKTVGTPDKDCYFIGHSLGCITILRYLEALKENQKIGGAILVAGFTSTLGFEQLESFFTKPINWKKIKSRCNKFIAIHSDDDPYVSSHYADFFKEKLGAEVIVQHNMKHFAGDDGVFQLPAVIDAILRMQ